MRESKAAHFRTREPTPTDRQTEQTMRTSEKQTNSSQKQNDTKKTKQNKTNGSVETTKSRGNSRDVKVAGQKRRLEKQALNNERQPLQAIRGWPSREQLLVIEVAHLT